MTFRGLVFTIVFILWTAIECVANLWLLFQRRPDILKHLAAYERSLVWLEKHILGLDYVIEGDLPRHGPALIAMKHQSTWETMMLHLLFDRPAVVLKKELMRIPLWGRYAAALDMIPIDRSAGAKAVSMMIEAAGRAVEQKRPIVVFPQGTRVAPGVARPYRGGIIRIYEATGLPIIPVALNSGLFWPRHPFIKRPGRITLRVLDSIAAGLDPREAMRLLESRLEEASAALLPGVEAKTA